jgi:hypothetical protein
MAISFTNYINITSGVIGVNQTGARSLGLRVFSINPLIPSNSLATFYNAAQVLSFFGSASTEYAIAAFYFGFVSKTISSPQQIDFSSWVEAAVAPTIYGAASATATLATLNTITSGRLNLTLGVTTQELSGINLSGAANLAAVATLLTTAINAVTTDPEWHTAVVTYNATTANFVLTGGVAAVSPVSIAAVSTGIDTGDFIGWRNINTVFSAGSGAMTLTQTLSASAAASNNFGSFSLIPAMSEAQHVEIAAWLETTNVEFLYLARVSSSTAVAVSAALIGFPGVSMTLDGSIIGQFPALLPGTILAATDYTKQNAAQNYMFQQDTTLLPNVTTDALSQTYDALRVNYYGQTQTNGQLISFYQRGFLTGGATAPTDIGTYVNEMWFKSAVADAFMNLLLAVNSVPTNNAGRAMILATLQSVIAQALFNSTISVANASLTNTQKLAISSIAGNTTAWQQIQTSGYWLNITFSSYVNMSGVTEYQANYTLIYVKNNSVRKVVGTHDLV